MSRAQLCCRIPHEGRDLDSVISVVGGAAQVISDSDAEGTLAATAAKVDRVSILYQW